MVYALWLRAAGLGCAVELCVSVCECVFGLVAHSLLFASPWSGCIGMRVRACGDDRV
eukprot:m.218956 g.218956  ORF g.218956 m.218956 type:complete len:57 (+) comp15608_c0_seq2:502-672(+)